MLLGNNGSPIEAEEEAALRAGQAITESSQLSIICRLIEVVVEQLYVEPGQHCSHRGSVGLQRHSHISTCLCCMHYARVLTDTANR